MTSTLESGEGHLPAADRARRLGSFDTTMAVMGRIMERARILLKANRALLDKFLDSRRDLECFRPPRGMVVFPRLARGDSEDFAAPC